MAETKEKKGFKAGLYAVIAGVLVAAILIGLTVFAFATRYNAFKPEKIATEYIDTIVQSGDGYNAYKYSLVSKNQKYGNFIINTYMAPYVNDGDDVKQADFVGKGNAEENKKSNKLYSDMFQKYAELVDKYGLDDYNDVFTEYFAALKTERETVYGDKYMDTEFMFSVFESNVATYGDLLKGTEKKIADDNKTILTPETEGLYQKIFGKDYKLTVSVKDTKALSDAEVKTYAEEYKKRIAPLVDDAEKRADQFGLKDVDKKHQNKTNYINGYKNLDSSDKFNAVSICTAEVKLENGTTVGEVQVYVVKIGNSWYVDDTNTDTSSLYKLGDGTNSVTPEAILQQKAVYDKAKADADAANAKNEK